RGTRAVRSERTVCRKPRLERVFRRVRSFARARPRASMGRISEVQKGARGSYSRVIMLKFSKDGPTADKQMRAVIFYLTTFGYIDGDFDASEKSFVRDYVGKLVEHRVHDAVPESDIKLRGELKHKFTTHFHE